MSTDSPDDMPILAPAILVASLNGRKSRDVLVEPDAAQCQHIAQFLGISAVRKFRFQATLRPLGAQDWELSGHLGATIVQPCAITLAPVTTRIDEPVARRYLAAWSEPAGEEVEMPEDDTQEPLGTKIDVAAVAIEALALALPDFPRAPGVVLTEEGVLRAAPEGQTPLDDDAVKPFAALASLRDKLGGS